MTVRALVVILALAPMACGRAKPRRARVATAPVPTAPTPDESAPLIANIANNLDKTTAQIEADNLCRSIVAQARAFVVAHTIADKYCLDRPWGLYSHPDVWEVWFRLKVADGKPFRCCVLISKEDGTASFKGLK